MRLVLLAVKRIKTWGKRQSLFPHHLREKYPYRSCHIHAQIGSNGLGLGLKGIINAYLQVGHDRLLVMFCVTMVMTHWDRVNGLPERNCAQLPGETAKELNIFKPCCIHVNLFNHANLNAKTKLFEHIHKVFPIN
ncbi:hypothetical protein SDC9_124870 [bioreactor metagenome]|uniref:Uncharacterized protein n=1 Tax=bioreactor metagenome TaxID=1076179 RepID=A0A645CM56_9ZZZZ